MQDVNNRETVCKGEDVYGYSVSFDQFFCKPKTTLK